MDTKRRDYKFRAWYMKEKCWIYYTLVGAECGVLEKYGLWLVDRCQFTGLFDKSCVEIYEGDIVKDIEHSCIELIPNNAMSRESWKTNGTLANIYDGFEYEVIGNIYENKELLEE